MQSMIPKEAEPGQVQWTFRERITKTGEGKPEAKLSKAGMTHWQPAQAVANIALPWKSHIYIHNYIYNLWQIVSIHCSFPWLLGYRVCTLFHLLRFVAVEILVRVEHRYHHVSRIQTCLWSHIFLPSLWETTRYTNYISERDEDATKVLTILCNQMTMRKLWFLSILSN